MAVFAVGIVHAGCSAASACNCRCELAILAAGFLGSPDAPTASTGPLSPGAGSRAKLAVLPRLPRPFGTGLSRILSDPAAGRTANGLHREPVAGIRRTPATQQHHGQCCARVEPGDDQRARDRDFQSLNPPPLGGAPKQLVAEGRKIFEGGVPDANVAACAACHGPEATGRDQIPRLAGQLYPYLVKELTNWGKERGQIPAHPDTSFIMAPVAHSLTRSEVEAVAAYLSYLK